jgi:hypothetical protein
MIRLLCPRCGHRLKIEPRYAGKKGKCPRCAEPLAIPALSAEESTPADPPAAAADNPFSFVDDSCPAEEPERIYSIDECEPLDDGPIPDQGKAARPGRRLLAILGLLAAAVVLIAVAGVVFVLMTQS